MSELQTVAITAVIESRNNPRKHFDKTALAELTRSVQEKGILVPLLVRAIAVGTSHGREHEIDHYEIVAGARRFRAAQAAKLEHIPVIIRKLTDEQALEVQVIENLQREDVHPLEEAEGYKQLLAKGKYDMPALAAKIGKSESYIYQRLKLGELIEPAKKAFLEEKITAGHAILLARLQPKDQAEALREGSRYSEGFASVRELAHWIEEHILLALKGAPWGLDDATLVPQAGSCTACPKRSGTAPALFADIKGKDICTDPACFEVKLHAHLVQIQNQLKADGKEAVLISAAYHGKAGALSYEKWTPGAEGVCPHVVTGLVVEGGWCHGRDYRRGAQVRICTEKKCKVHWDPSYGSSSSRSGVDKAKERKTRALELARTEALRQIAAKKRWPLSTAEIRQAALAFLGRTTFDSQKLFCKISGVWPKDGKTGDFDFRDKGEQFVKGQDIAGLARTLTTLALLPTYGRWGDGYYGSEEIPALRQAGKHVKVNVEALERQFIKAANDKAKKKFKPKAAAKKVKKAA